MRSNGFERPFHPSQVGIWILLPTLLIQFLLFATPVLPLAAAIPCTICVFICGIAAAFFAYKCCSIDPIDDLCKRHFAKKDGETEGGNISAGEEGEGEEKAGDEGTRHCWICCTDVRESSVHCQFCGKCTAGFDHHCLYLNTCVGKANYQYFLWVLGSTLSMVIARGGILSGLVITFFIQYAQAQGTDGGSRGTTLDQSNSWLGADTDFSLFVAIVNTVFISIDITCTILLAQLFFFHVRLRKLGTTTYKYLSNNPTRQLPRGSSVSVLKEQEMQQVVNALNDT